MPRRLTLLLCLLALLGAVRAVEAHGVIESASPPANTVLSAPIPQVVVRFNEPVDAAFSTVSVTTAAGNRVSQTPVFSLDGRTMTVRVALTSQGLYTLRWRALSLIDGHTTAGSYVFSLGEPIAQRSLSGAPEPPSPLVIALRWFSLLAGLSLAGASLVFLAVVQPAFRVLSHSNNARLQRAARGVRRTLTVVAAPLLLTSVIGEAVLEAGALLNVPFWQVASSPALWPLLSGTKLGWSVLIRVGMAVLFLIAPSPRGRLIQGVALV